MRAENFSIDLPKAPLGFFPTPLAEMERLSRHLGGPRIWIKRDDLTGLALGGNKVRKLEYLFGEALAADCDSVITAGAVQSNHCRQTAAAAATLGLPCHLALGGEAPALPNGNLLLDGLFGAKIHWCGDARKGERIPEIERELREQGRRPYVIPYGGSNATGAAGFVAAMLELAAQPDSENASAILFASSSGGTQSGLTVGVTILQSRVSLIGIEIDKDEAGEGSFAQHVRQMANDTAERLGVEKRYDASEILLKSDYVGAGYGVVGDLEREAIRLAAQYEGILLDPVYTGRAFGALIDLIAKREFGKNDRVIFWHTGGAPALFAYAKELGEF